MSHYVMYETTVTRHNFDVAMMPDGSLAVEELHDALQAAWDVAHHDRADSFVVSPTRVTVIDDMIRIYFDITERK